MEFHYDDFMDEGIPDECDQIRTIAKKSWLNTTTASLANLDKVKTNVYNFGIADPRDLKGTNIRAKPPKPVTANTGDIAIKQDGHDDNKNGTLNSLKAWGSNHSIPELLQQYGGHTLPKPTRPASAKINNGRIRPPSGRKPRPQSAKEPFPDGNVAERAFGVKGAKYDPSGRPPKGVPSGSGVGWVGPPAGLKYPDRPPDGKPWTMELPVADENADDALNLELTHQEGFDIPRAPNASPVPSSPVEEKKKRVFELYIGDPYKTNGEAEGMFESSDEEDLYETTSPVNHSSQSTNHSAGYYSATPPQFELTNQRESDSRLTNEKESLRLSLPTAEDEYDPVDDMDTERLLAEAESVSKQFDLKNIIQANKGVSPDTEETSPLQTDKNSHLEDLNSKQRAEELVTKIISENGIKFDKTDQGNEKELGSVDDHVKSGVKFNEDVTTVNITPRNIGRKVEELHQKKKPFIHHNNDNFVDLIEIKNRVEPVLATGKAEFSQRENLSPKSKSSSRPPSGKSSSASAKPQNKQTPNSVLKKTGSQAIDSTVKPSNVVQTRNMTSTTRPRSASGPLNRAPRAITTVTVDYAESEAKENDQDKREIKQKKPKKPKDVLSMMEKLALEDQDKSDRNEDRNLESDFNDMFSDLISAPTVYKSDPVKNYYEISRHSSLSNHTLHKDEPKAATNKKVNPPKNDENLHRENTVFKTTKTIEFDENNPKELSVKSVIDPLAVSTKEKERHLATSPELKRRKPPSRPSSAKPPVAKKPDVEPEERPGSRLGFVAMAPGNSPGEKVDRPKRPASAPTNRRQVSAGKEPKDKTNAKSEKKAKDDKTTKELTEKEKQERDKVIDDLLERTRTLVDENRENEGDEQSASTSGYKKPVTDKRKLRPHSAHVGTIAGGCKGHGSRSLLSKRPLSATAGNDKHYASYSRGGQSGSRPRKTSSGKPKVVLTEPCIINTLTPYYEEETEEDLECQAMEQELAEKGVHISAATLQRALYPPSGKSKYYQITAELPKKPSLSLLSHPKVWLPDEYKRLQKAEKTLTRANEIMYLQEKAEKRKAYLESLTPEQRKKLKKKGKKSGKKLKRSKSTL